MKLSTKGIGWLIAGAIICLSATESYGLMATLSTIALGMVFILIYVMKQLFDPSGIGWFIAGGVLLAFLVEEGLTEEGLTTLVISIACLVAFYLKNREELQAILNGEQIVYDDEYYEEDEAYAGEEGAEYANEEYADEQGYDENVQAEGPYDEQGAVYVDEQGAVYADEQGANREDENDQDVVFEINQNPDNQ